MKRGANLWLLVLVLVFAGSWYFGREAVDDPTPELAAPVEKTASYARVAAEDETIHLRILNGTTTPGLARDFSLLLGRAGCVAESVGNAPHERFADSILVNRRLSETAASRLAEGLGGLPVITEWAEGTSEDAVLVLGADCGRIEAALSEFDTVRK